MERVRNGRLYFRSGGKSNARTFDNTDEDAKLSPRATDEDLRSKRGAFVDSAAKFNTSVTSEFLPPNFQLNAESTKLEELRLNVFKTVLKGSGKDVLKILKQVKDEDLSLADPVMLDPRNDMNILHLALDRGRTEIATVLIENCSDEILKQVFTLAAGSRTALHQITGLRNVTLINKVLSKFDDLSEKRELVQKETEFYIEQGRPRSMSSLHLAAFKGFTEIVKVFIELGVDVNLQSKKGNTALQWAARQGHNDTLTFLLENDADANIVSDTGSTALYWAVRNNHTNIVKTLLEKGQANPNHQREIGLGFPIMVASALGNKNMVEDLIQHGANVNSVTQGQISSLYHAAKGGHFEVVKLLLHHKADLKCEEKNGNNALLLAAANNHPEIVKELIQHGDDVTHSNQDGQDIWYFALTKGDNRLLEAVVDHYQSLTGKRRTEVRPPVCIAAKLGRNDKIEKLIELGVTPLRTDSKRNTFLHYAALYNQSQVIKKFVRYVNIDAKNEDRETALHVACRNGSYLAAKDLMDRGAKVGITNKNGENALHVVASSDKTCPQLAKSVIDHLIKLHDWDTINAKTSEGKNALHLAASLAGPDIIWELRSVKSKDKDKDGNTPFHAAVRPDCKDALDTMLDIYDKTDREADINAKNANDETVLHLAASAGFLDHVIRLIEYGADLSSQDKSGNTVLHRLVTATIEDSENDELYLKVADCVFNYAVTWWCKKENCSFPNDDEARFIELNRLAILTLLHDLKNTQKLSVLAFAFKLAADKFLSKILTLDNVMTVIKKKNIYYDITAIIPSSRLKKNSKDSNERSTFAKCSRNLMSLLFPSSVSNIERLLKSDAKERVTKVLDIPPIRELEKMYTSLCARIYAFLMFLHICYMCLFTFFGIFISSKFRGVSKGELFSYSDPVLVLTYVVIPSEPLIFVLYSVSNVLRTIKRKEKPSGILVLNVLTAFLFSLFTFVWIILVASRNFNQDYILAICLCSGWIASISLTRGFRKVHFFYRMLLNVIVSDISRFLFVFVFVWLGFGFALHVVIQFSDELVKKYDDPPSTLFLLFNIAVGMYELFDDEFDQSMTSVGRTATFAKGLYMIYIVLGTIILLNLLIAMMNDSYSRILKDQQINWRIDTVTIGVEMEYIFPKLLSVFRKATIQKQYIRYNKEERWYLIIDNDQSCSVSQMSRRSTHAISSKPFSFVETMQKYPLMVDQQLDDTDGSKQSVGVSSQQLENLQKSLKKTESSVNSNISDLELRLQRIEHRLDTQEKTNDLILKILQEIKHQSSESHA